VPVDLVELWPEGNAVPTRRVALFAGGSEGFADCPSAPPRGLRDPRLPELYVFHSQNDIGAEFTRRSCCGAAATPAGALPGRRPGCALFGRDWFCMAFAGGRVRSCCSVLRIPRYYCRVVAGIDRLVIAGSAQAVPCVGRRSPARAAS